MACGTLKKIGKVALPVAMGIGGMAATGGLVNPLTANLGANLGMAAGLAGSAKAGVDTKEAMDEEERRRKEMEEERIRQDQLNLQQAISGGTHATRAGAGFTPHRGGYSRQALYS